MTIEGTELNVYYEDGSIVSMALSEKQTEVVIKILGLSRQANGDVTCLSDESLEQIAEMKGNPLKLRVIE